MGYIRLDRKILEWSWYKDTKTKAVFIHCLLSANWKDGNFKGTPVSRGSFVTSLPSLCEATGLTVGEVRVALKHLKTTGEIAVKNFNKFRIITVSNYGLYQDDNSQGNSQIAGKEQADNSNRIREEGKKLKREEYMDYCSEPETDSEPPVITLPLNDGSEYPITESDIKNWQNLYPAVDIMQELRKMRGWCDANPAKRKTKRGILKFIHSWLSKEQDRGGSYRPPAQPIKSDPFDEWLKEEMAKKEAENARSGI